MSNARLKLVIAEQEAKLWGSIVNGGATQKQVDELAALIHTLQGGNNS